MKGRVTGSSTTTAPSGSSGAGASGGSSSASAGCHSNIIRIIESVSFQILIALPNREIFNAH